MTRCARPSAVAPPRTSRWSAGTSARPPTRSISSVESERFDILVLDGEAAKVGGLGLARQLKNEIFECPPIVVLTGRPQDSWLAAWSQADLAVPHPLDPIALTSAIATLARSGVPTA